MDSLDSSHAFTNSLEESNPPKSNVFKSKIFIVAVSFSSVLFTIMCIGFLVHYEMASEVYAGEDIPFWNVQLPPEQQVWYEKGIEELKNALSREINRRRAKNVILFVGDGMGPNTVTATRIYGFKEEGLLSWERFPHMGLLKVSALTIFKSVFWNIIYTSSRPTAPTSRCLIRFPPLRRFLVALRSIMKQVVWTRAFCLKIAALRWMLHIMCRQY